MNYSIGDKIQEVNVEFYEATYGWLCFKVSAGDQVFDGRFSEVFDPIMDLKKWLEAIAIGVKQTSFNFDPEGDDVKFDFDRKRLDTEVLTICQPYGDEIYLKVNVERKQVVNAFYRGLIDFSKSDRYDPREWEVEYMWERLCKIMKMDEIKLIDWLLELDRQELGKVLFDASPCHLISFPSAQDKNEEFNLFLKSVETDSEKIGEHDLVRTPIYWDIPDDYDYWPSHKKMTLVTKYLQEKATGYEGVKLKEFRSVIIEKYLYEE